MSRRLSSRLRVRVWACSTLTFATALVACNALTGIDEKQLVDSLEPDSALSPIPEDAPLSGFDVSAPPTDSSGADHYTLSPDAETRRVFVTSGYWSANDVGGIAGANAKCIEAAKSAKLGGNGWVAWLSTTEQNAKDQLLPNVAYVLVDGNTVVATSLQELTSGALLHPISLTERGNGVGPTLQDTAVWTGTKPDGTLVDNTNNCNEFPDLPVGVLIPGNGVVGSCWTKSGQWTNMIEQNCTTWPGRFYCFEL